jgi:hypothetical protein
MSSPVLLNIISEGAKQALLMCTAAVPVDAMDVVTVIPITDGFKQAYSVDIVAKKYIQMLAAITPSNLMEIRSKFTSVCVDAMLDMYPLLRIDRDAIIGHLGNCLLTTLAAHLRIDSASNPPRYQLHLYNYEGKLPQDEQSTLTMHMLLSLVAHNCASQCMTTLQFHNHWRDILLSTDSQPILSSTNDVIGNNTKVNQQLRDDTVAIISNNDSNRNNSDKNSDSNSDSTGVVSLPSQPAKSKITTAVIITICTVCGLAIIVGIIICCAKYASNKKKNQEMIRSW